MAHTHEFHCSIHWSGGPTLSYEGYAREHVVRIAGKPELRASAGGAFRGDESLHNPEDLLVAALSSCHMLSYLWVCARAKVPVIAYEDTASGTMQLVEKRYRFTEVMLRPRVTLSPGGDTAKALALHADAHQTCFIASSVNFPVRHEAEVMVGG